MVSRFGTVRMSSDSGGFGEGDDGDGDGDGVDDDGGGGDAAWNREDEEKVRDRSIMLGMVG